eukprot:TRINITY_DN112216_c0_g1_i1.p1 TRINITY_DN112216_c0_g1~~TRINITY_DN112216_c0_g1_i1.p1  ORF type:complete len:373 (+),score=67.80 TRINITY_DN112216_c0_g1_i1:115-1233(+)
MSSCFDGNTTSMESPQLKPKQSPFEFTTPSRGPLKSPAFSFTSPKPKQRRNSWDDECSTAAPSPAPWSPGLSTPGSSQPFGSPCWGSPSLPQPARSRGRMASGLRTIHSNCDFFNLASTFGEGLVDMPPFELTPMVDSPPPPLGPQGLVPSPLAQQACPPSCDDTMMCTPPSSPRRQVSPGDDPMTPPSAGRMPETPKAPKKPQATSLMKALAQAASSHAVVQHVQAVLEKDPDAALMPFWEHNMEPPICYAVRNGCDVEVIKLLLKFGADAKDVTSTGKSVLDLLEERSMRFDHATHSLPWCGTEGLEAERQNLERVKQVLVEAGARPSADRALADCESLSAHLFFNGRGVLPPWPTACGRTCSTRCAKVA